MDEKMKAAFDVKYSDDTYRWCRIDAILWTISYLRSQQEPAILVATKLVPYEERTFRGSSTEVANKLGYTKYHRFYYAHPIPLPADPPNEALMEAFDRYQAAKVAYQGSVSEVSGTKFYLQDSRSYVGNDVLFWRKGDCGYTTNVSEAQTYTRDEAQRQHDSRPSDIPWPKAYIDAKTRPAVDMQYIKRDEALQGSGIVLRPDQNR